MLDKLLNNDANKIKNFSYIWNFLSSIAKAIQLTIFLALISRATTQGDTGIMSLAFSIAYLMRTIGDYSMRNFQVTDTAGKYTFADYAVSRAVTLLLMIICSFIYVLSRGYDFDKTMTIILVCLYMGIDALEDVFHGALQQQGRLDIACFTEFVRYVCGVIVFAIALFITKEMWISTFVLVCFSMFLFCILNFPFKHIWGRIERTTINKRKVGELLWECFPLFIGAFLSAYINNAPKNAIDEVLNDEAQGYFGMIFMPVFVVNLFSAIVYRPITLDLAQKYEADPEQYVKSIKKQYMIIAGIMTICVLGAFILGIPLLSLFYQVSLGQYKVCLIILMTAGGICAAISFSGTLLTIQRKQKTMFYAFGASAIMSMVFSSYFVRRWDVLGASLLYIMLNAIILIIMCIAIEADIYRRKKIVQ